ncbi:MAG: peptide deformylase [Candidatus Omnitrophota bacterium]|nr:peptide deformylase [Candidatus Omnitrophota bacterium]
MSVRPICVEPHPVLRRAARPVAVFSEEIRRMARDMIETMYANDGIGLAAPQIGQDLQVFIANPSQERGREVVVVNPVLESTEGRATIVEGCLSVPNVWERVRRAARVRLRGQDAQGQALSIEAHGLLAIVLQHELDHLQGRLFIDRIAWWRRCLVKLKAIGRK